MADFALNEPAKQRVLDEIVTAFDDVPMPQFNEILNEQSAADPAAEKIQEDLAGLAWENISAEHLLRRWPSFCYLSPAAIQYYLPAVLIAALEQGGIDLLWACVSELSPGAFFTYNDGTDEHFDEQFSLFTPEQEMAVVSYLGLFVDPDQPTPFAFRAGFAFRFGWDREEWPALEPFAGFYHAMRHFEWPEPDDPETADLVAQIRDGFDEAPYPGDEDICIVNEGDDPAMYALEFADLDWRTIHPEFLSQYYAAPTYFTPNGLRYFLPAFLVADLIDTGVRMGADPVFHLTQGFSESADTPESRFDKQSDEPAPDLFTYSVTRMSAFTRPEREAIIRYLEYKAQFDPDAAPDIETALDRYWRPSLAE